MKRARAWVNKKLRQGVSKKELYRCIGLFSNKKKDRVMQEKQLTEKQYKQRYDFLYNAFCYLESN